MLKRRGVLLIGAALFLAACPPATPPPAPEQACVWQPESAASASARLTPTPTNSGATEPITADNVGHVRELARLERGPVYGVYPGPNPDTAAVLSGAGVEIYDTELRQTMLWFYHIRPGPGDMVSPDGRLLVGRSDSQLRLWDLTSGRLLCEADAAPYQGVSHIAWSPDGRQVATAMGDGNAWVWNPESGRDLRVLGTWRPRDFLALDPRVITLITAAWSPDGRDLAFTNRDHVLEIWDVSEPQPVLQLLTPRKADDEESPHPIDSFAWSSDGNCVRIKFKNQPAEAVDAVSGETCDGKKEWATAQNASDSEIASLLTGGGGSQLVWSPDSAKLAAAQDDKVSLLDPVAGATGGTWPATAGTTVRHVQWLSDGLYRLVGPESLSAEWELAWEKLNPRDATQQEEADAQLNVLERFEELADSDFAFSPDGKQLVARAYEYGSLANSLHLWDLTSNTGRTVLEAPKFWHGAISWSPDGALLAVAFERGSTQILDTASWAVVSSLPGDAFVWAPDGKRIAAVCATEDGTPVPAQAQLCIYDAATGQPLGPQLIVNGVSPLVGVWSPDGKLLATDNYSDLLIWEVETGKLLHTLHNPDGWRGLVWSLDGRMLASVTGPIRIWGIPAETASTEEND